MLRRRAGKLPIATTEVASWWGTNPAKRAADGIDVLAADREARELIIGKCKYRTTFDATAELRDLDSKRDLIKGYHAQYLYLFSRFDLSGALGVSWTARNDVRCVSLDDMYAGV